MPFSIGIFNLWAKNRDIWQRCFNPLFCIATCPSIHLQSNKTLCRFLEILRVRRENSTPHAVSFSATIMFLHFLKVNKAGRSTNQSVHLSAYIVIFLTSCCNPLIAGQADRVGTREPSVKSICSHLSYFVCLPERSKENIKYLILPSGN